MDPLVGGPTAFTAHRYGGRAEAGLALGEPWRSRKILLLGVLERTHTSLLGARCPGCLRALQRCPTCPPALRARHSLSFSSLPLLVLKADISGSPERGQDAQNNSFRDRRKMSLAEPGAKQRARRTWAAPCRSRAPRGWALLAGFCWGWKRALAWLESSGCAACSCFWFCLF